MNKSSVRDLGVGLFFLGISVLYLAGTFSISVFSPFGNRGLDSRSIPQLIGILACLLSIVQLFAASARLRKSFREKEHGLPSSGPDSMDKTAGRKATFLLVVSLALLGAYIFLFQKIGFILSTILYLMFSVTLLTPAAKRRRLMPFIVLFSSGVPFLIYFIFTKYLSLILPRGILG